MIAIYANNIKFINIIDTYNIVLVIQKVPR